MRRRIVGAVVCTLALVVGQAPSSWAAATPPAECSTEDFNGDPRLGPRDLPTQGAVGLELRTYDRLGGLTAEQFIATWWDPAANHGQGGWRFPPEFGFRLGEDGQPIRATMTLRVGQRIDRFGSEFGGFLAPVGSLYSQRALPPQSLDNAAAPSGCNYNLYKVGRDFAVDGGPIAPAFGQPGNGLQYRLVGALVPGAPALLNVRWLIDNGYVTRCILIVSRPYAC
ncbi:MAG: TNT domain-containing protein [Acidimicrobiales bacterium]